MEKIKTLIFFQSALEGHADAFGVGFFVVETGLPRRGDTGGIEPHVGEDLKAQ